MKRSIDRILTTHTGRLERPDAITDAMESASGGRPDDAGFAAQLRTSISDIVKEQKDAGVDIVNDGEFGKLSWMSYLNSRLGGHTLVPKKKLVPVLTLDRRSFPEFYSHMDGSRVTYYRSSGRDTPPDMRWACTSPVVYQGQSDLQQDIDLLKAAAKNNGVDESDVFVTATSPLRPNVNEHYATDEDYFVAVGEAMRTEYKAIVDAGFVLQIDDPWMACMWEWASEDSAAAIAAYRKKVEGYVEILNHALSGIPEDRVRYHMCWGSWHGPHAHDLPLNDIVDLLLRIKAEGYLLEAANPRHEHEWAIWSDVKLPDGKILIPGLVAHATNTIEHPELISQRIQNFARLVGRENLIAGTDCGLGYRVHNEIGWAKLRALAEGSALASKVLWKH